MMQQINLYQPMFRKHEKVFSVMTMLQISLFFIVVFAGIYGYTHHQLVPFKQEVAKLDKELAQLSVLVSKLEQQQLKKVKSKLLEKEIARLSNELAKRERIHALLTKYTFGNSTGFSAHLEALARQHVQGAWLTRISIAGGGASLGLEGKTLLPELVPAYIQRLADEKVLIGASFNNMELNRSEEVEDRLNFKISTK